MKPALIKRLHKNFEDYVHVQEGVEFWFARDLQNLLGYTEWRNFNKVIEKAKESCQTSNNAISDHFVDVNKMVPLGSGSERELEDKMIWVYSPQCRWRFYDVFPGGVWIAKDLMEWDRK